MQDKNSRIVFLLSRQINKEELTSEEKDELDNWLAQSPHNRLVLEDAMNEQILHDESKRFLETDEEEGARKFAQRIAGDPGAAKLFSFTGNYRKLYAAAAVLLILLAVGGYFFFGDHKTTPGIATTEPEKKSANDIAPGHDGAILKLADGSTIILDNAANGVLTTQGSTKLIKTGEGQLVYQATGKEQRVLYNTLSTPRGRKFQLSLPDGSNIWLNAESSITYPLAFVGNERKVEISGEAYFEVVKNPKKPFRVTRRDMTVEVLGTNFNINAYEDENSVSTTLLEGLVKIVNSGKNSFLRPGQQARANTNGEIKIVNDVNADEVIAWKNGLFIFQSADIKTIMRQVRRWYDVEISYEKEISQTFTGTIPRTVNASKLLGYLELTKHVRFRIEGRKVVVTK